MQFLFLPVLWLRKPPFQLLNHESGLNLPYSSGCYKLCYHHTPVELSNALMSQGGGLSIQDGLFFISSIHLIQKMGIYMGELFRVLNYKSNGNLCFGWSLMEINGENLVEVLDVLSCGIIDGQSSWCILLVRSFTEKLDHPVI